MDIFPSANLPGVGMGNITTIVGLGGLLGMAVTSGILIAEGAVGGVIWALSAVALLLAKDPHFGDAPALTLGLIAVTLLLGLIAAMRARAADAEVDRGRFIALLAVLVGGASVGFGWAEWNEVPFTLGDPESYVGTVLGVVAAAVGGHAAHLFVRGSVRAGGSALIVGVVTCVVSLMLNAASFYLPFAGIVVLLLVLIFGIRLAKRARAKYKGLRILA